MYDTIFKTQDNFGAYLNCCLITSKIHHAILNLNDKQRKNKLVNFKLHISMIATCFFFNHLEYNVDGISQINISNFSDQIIEKAFLKTDDLIESYQKNNPNSNLSNMAKSSDFTTYIKNNLSQL